jgi:branched-chain amino acid transport system ATP-binding protein
VVGHNGAGKTTLLKTIGGFLKPNRGSINFRGESIVGMLPEKIALGVLKKYIFRDKLDFGELTVRDNVELAVFPTREALNQVMEKLLAIHPKMHKLLNSRARGLCGA